MQKHTMIGVNEYDRCGLLSCLMDFDAIKTIALCDTDLIEANDFTYIATGWNGCDGLECVLVRKDLELTGGEITLKKPLVFHGKDYDHGHENPWTVTVTKILEVRAL